MTTRTRFYTFVLLVVLGLLALAPAGVRFLAEAAQANTVVMVSSASFETVVAPDSIATAFGSQLATTTAVGTDTDPNTAGVQLPTTLGGTFVEINGRRAGLFFISPTQINLLLPPETAAGVANVRVVSGAGTVSTGTVAVSNVAPAIFTANSDGRGVPAGVVLRVKQNGAQSFEPLLVFDARTGKAVSVALDLGPEGEQVFLILFTTGVRRASDANGDSNVNETVRVVFAGAETTPQFIGKLTGLAGLDQGNVLIPRSLIGRGKVSLSISAPGANASNVTEIEIAGGAGTAPPQVNGFSTGAALAGQAVTIQGNGFSTTPGDNLVRIGDLEAPVTVAAPTQLTVIVPFGAESAPVSVRTAMGESSSADLLNLRTSVSGVVETTARQPLSDVTVQITSLVNGQTVTTRTSSNGAFVAADTPTGGVFMKIIGSSVATAPLLETVTVPVAVGANRDNSYGQTVYLQPVSGASAQVGGSGFASNADPFSLSVPVFAPLYDLDDTAALAPTRLQTGNVIFDLPDGVAVRFPDGAPNGQITLTQIESSRVPVRFPAGVFSSIVVQITPFGTSFNPGGKLTFPNPDGYTAGSLLKLFKLEQGERSPNFGRFVEVGTATVSGDGQRIETGANAITEAAYYFAGGRRQTTTVIGRALDADRTPVRRALIRARGQEEYTDGNGGFILRNVPVNPGTDLLTIEASLLRASGRVERLQRTGIPVVKDGTTQVTPELVFNSNTVNQAPFILAPAALTVNAGQTTDVAIFAGDPDSVQPVNLAANGASFASVIPNISVPRQFVLRFRPANSDAGTRDLTLVATDTQGASVSRVIRLTVVIPNRAPAANNQNVTTDEDTPKQITLGATDADNDALSYMIVTPPTKGALTGTPPNLTYTPNANFNGADTFRFKASDGELESNVATVTIGVTPVNDTPVLTVPGAQSVKEGELVMFTVTATDVDEGQTLRFTASNLPTGASFIEGTQKFSWTPGFTQSGAFTVAFAVMDNGVPPKGDTKSVTITVGNTNRAPAANAASVMTDEDKALPITLTGSDPDGSQITFAVVTQPTKGALTGTAPNLTYTPNANFNGTDSFTFKVNDGTADSPPATVTITVKPINDAPVANNQSVTTDEDAPKQITLTGSDVDGNALSYAVVTQPTKGALTGTAPNLTYTPNANVNGTDSFTFRVNDGTTNSANATVTITIRPTSDPPRAIAQQVTTDEDTPCQITLSGVDPDNGPLAFVVLTLPRNGTLTGGLNNLTYTPRKDFNGSDSFTFKVSDGANDSAPATVSITVNGVNDPPQLSVPAAPSVPEGQLITFTVSATDPEGQTVKVTAPSRPTGASFVESSGFFTWTPTFDQAGTYNVGFAATDNGTPAQTAFRTVTITVTNVNRAPRATAQTVTTNEDTAANITLAGTDPDSDTLAFMVVAQPQRGSLSGTVPNLRYTPAANANGADSFTFKANDSKLDSPLAIVTINVTPVNDAPVINVPGTQNIKEGQQVNLQLTATDVDTGQTRTFSSNNLPTGATLSPAGAFAWKPGNKQAGTFTINFAVTDNGTPPLNDTATTTFNVTNPAPVATNQTIAVDEDTPEAIALSVTDPDADALTYSIINQPMHGSLSGTAPNLTYTPALNYNGADSFTFRANDGVANSNTATINLTVNPINDAPVLGVPPAQTVNEGQALNFNVSATDVDTGQTLTFTAASLPSGANFNAATRAFSWTPNSDQQGMYTVSFTVTDNGNPVRNDTETVKITVNNVNRAPVANNQTVTTNEDTAKAITLTGSDPDGNALTYAIVAQPTKGTLTGTAPNLTYTPTANANGADSFTFEVNDGTVDSNTATVSITITALNDAPVLTVPGAQTANEGVLLQFTITATDVDAGQTKTFSATGLPTGATLNQTSGAFSWTPNFGQAGTYDINFTVTDNGTPPLNNSKTVRITVNDVNSAPTAANKTATTNEDTAVNVTLTATDPQNDPLTFSIVAQPQHGTLTGTPPSVTYTPAANFNGTATFTYEANDGKLDSNTATVTITVNPVNDAPVANNQSVQVTEDTPKAITLAATDLDGNTLTFAIVTQPAKGTLTGTAPNLTYTPTANATGADSFTFRANDGTVNSNTATVSITIGGVNDPPVANGQSVTTNEDIAKAITLAASDPDGNTLTYIIVAQPTKGALTGTAPNLTYTPTANATGADSFTFKVNDGTVDSNTATVSITITALNDAPVLTVPGAQMVDEGVLLQFTVSATDVDSGQTLTFTTGALPTGATFNAQTRTFQWTPGFDQAGNYTVNFTVTDNGTPVLNNTKSVAITVKDRVRGPVANPQSVTTNEDTAKAITLTGSDPDGLPITYSIVTPPAHGALTGTAPNVTYTPATNYNGADSFTFKTNNGSLDSNAATVNITVTPVNDPPTISAPDSRTANEGEAISFNVTRADVDTGQTLTLSSTALPTGATFNTTTGAFAWTPSFTQAGNHSITFTVTDNGSPVLNAMKTTTFTINNQNRPPVANSFPVSTNEDTAKAITLTGSDPDNDTLTFAIVAQPMHGTLTGTPPNMNYTPALNYNGQDTFTYKVNDGTVDSTNALVTITVTPVNDPPVINVPGTQQVSIGQPVSFSVSAMDVDTGQTITLSVANLPTGANFNSQTGAFSWTPTSAGTVTVNFTATDNGSPALSDAGPVQIVVGQTNVPPSCTSQNTSTNEDTAKQVTLACTDPNSNPLTYIIVAQPANGMVTLSGTTATYTPAANFNGQDSFTFKANDGSLDSPNATVSITVNPTCDPPVLTVPGAQTVGTGNELFFTVTANDPDGGTLTLQAMNLPSGASFTTPSPNLGEFRWTPAPTFPLGNVTVTFKVTDNCTPTALTDTKTVNINVTQGTQDWTQTPGPEAGKITAIAIGASNNIFVGTQGGGVFRSTNNGDTWAAANGGLINRNITALVFRNGVLYAGTAGDGVFRSTNNGGAWSQFNTGLRDGFVFQLVANDTHLFAAASPTVFTNQNIYRTALSEADWSAYDFGLTPTFFTDLHIAGTQIFAATFTEGIFTSPTNEASWVDFNIGLPGNRAAELKAQARAQSRRGNSRFLVEVRINALTSSGANIYAGTDQGVFISPLNEAGWTSFNTGLDANASVVSIEAIGSSLYARAETRFFIPVDMIVYDVVKSPLGTAGWTTANTGIANRAVNAFAANGSTIFAGTEGSGVYRTTNAGANWAAINAGLSAAFVNLLFVKDTRLFAGLDGGGVFTSDDNGESWAETNNGLAGLLPLGINAFAVNDTSLYAGTNGRGVYRSTNDGGTWAAFNNAAFTNTPVRDLLVSDMKIFAAAGDLGLFVSQLANATWTQVTGGLPALLEVTALFKTPTHLFLGTGGGTVYRSDLAGTNWTQVGTGLNNSAPVTAFALRGTNLLVGRNGDGVYRSTNNGDSFTQVVSGLSNQSVAALHSDGVRVYAATNGGGVFITSNDGTNWTQSINSLTNLRARTVIVKEGLIFVGTEGSGVFSRPQ